MADVELSTLGAVIKPAYEGQADTNAYTDAEKTKLSGVEASADVTDATNVAAAGALMDSEVTNLAAVKVFDPADYATAAQGGLADDAVQPGDALPQTAITDLTGLTLSNAVHTYTATAADVLSATAAAGATMAIWITGSANAITDSGITWLGGADINSINHATGKVQLLLQSDGTDVFASVLEP